MSILADVIDRDLLAHDAEAALRDACLQVRRAGLEHLVTAATPDIVRAMAFAGEQLAAEHASLVAAAIRAPGAVARVFDGGETEEDALLMAAVGAIERGLVRGIAQ